LEANAQVDRYADHGDRGAADDVRHDGSWDVEESVGLIGLLSQAAVAFMLPNVKS